MNIGRVRPYRWKKGWKTVSIQHFWAAGVVALAVIAKLSQGLLAEEAKIVRHVDTAEKVIAFTFDDGPNPKTTPELLQVLREKNVKATFFVLGENAKVHPELVEKALSEGHEIGSHSYTHRHLKNLSQAECAEELDKADAMIRTVAPGPTLFRPPGGLYNEGVLAEAGKRGYTTILWSIDPTDWKRPGVDYVVKEVMKKAKPGGIVLMHDGMSPLPTPKAVAILIDRLRADGYAIVTVSELLKYEEAKQTDAVDGSRARLLVNM